MDDIYAIDFSFKLNLWIESKAKNCLKKVDVTPFVTKQANGCPFPLWNLTSRLKKVMKNRHTFSWYRIFVDQFLKIIGSGKSQSSYDR